MTHTITMNIPESFVFGSKVAGEFFQVYPHRLDESWLVECLRYGIQRKVNDGVKGDTDAVRLDLARMMTEGMNKGEAFEGRSRGGSSTMSDVDKRTLVLAKDALKKVFRLGTGKAKIADWVDASDKIAAFFDEGAWIDARVFEWVDKQAESGKADYRKEAETQLADEKALADSIDLDDL